MKANEEDKSMEAGVMLERTRSTVSTTIMANTEVSRHNKNMRTKQSNVIDLQIIPNHSNINTFNKSTSSQASKTKKKERSTLLDRLTIVNVEASSSKKKNGRRKHDSSVQRNHQPPPEELLLRDGQQDSVSMIPDCFSNTFMDMNSKGNDHGPANSAVNDHGPALFTFDIVTSLSRDSSCRENGKEIEEDDSIANYTTNTTDANIGDDDDDISGIFDELDEKDAKCVNAVVEKYSASKNDTNTSVTKEMNGTNMETLVALSKLELTSRTRTESTAFLSETSSNDTSLQFDKEPMKLTNPSKLSKNLQDEATLVARDARDELQVKASRCISFNMFSMFD
jgi:hypothetical protein